MSATEARHLSRRTVLALLSGAGALLAMRFIPDALRRRLEIASAHAASPDLLERNTWPEHWETTVDALGRSAVTPNDRFFVRSHLPVPELDAATHRVEVAGLVSRPQALDLAALRAMPRTDVLATLECAGNGRGLMPLHNTSGTQWALGAVGTANWSGVALREVLSRAEVSREAAHVWFEAADEGPFPQTPRFVRSIPLVVALERAFLVYAMNDQALPSLHGGPVRVIVPGWYGMASTKWVTRIRVESTPSDNHFMVNGYRYVAPGADPKAAPPVETVRVKSLITQPLDGGKVPAGGFDVRGFAWSGAGRVTRVQVSTDGGAKWSDAALDPGDHPDGNPYAWRRWSLRVPGAVGKRLLLARATDETGATQPLTPEINAAGYGNNASHLVTVFADA
jgi:DMSO/TMAO reductase YedYZ molybdopterin-dependent catalytic subunit